MNEWETCIDEWAERLRVSQKETADAQATIADLHGQIDKLANFIMREVPGEPAKSEGAVECAMRVISVLQQRVAQLERKLVSMTESRDAWQKSQEGTEKAYMALATQIPSERFDYDPVNLALLESAKEQEEIGRKQIADLQSSLSRLTQKYAYIEKEAALAYEKIVILQADHARVLGLVQALPMAGLPVEHARSDDFVVLQTNGEWMAHTYNYWAKFATEEEAQAYIALLEYRASLPSQPAQGHEHTWGTDGAHSNEFCKVCFVNKPQPAQGGA